MAPKYFDVPWAESGDKTTIPNTTQPSGDVSYPEGWTPDYELDQTGGPPAKDVERQKENQFKFDVTEFLKQVQENGIPLYNANFNYPVGAYTLASDAVLYQALIANGPATTVRDPIGDTTGTWISSGGDIRSYIATFDFVPGDYVKGSDFSLYVCIADNGPSSTPVDPVDGDHTIWVPLKSDVRNWVNSFVYIAASNDFAKGSDGTLYRALTDSGPGTVAGAVNPVGDVSGAWRTSGPNAGLRTTYLTASDPVWAPAARARSIRITVTGGGGGGGGINSGGASPISSGGGGGGAGGTAVYSFNRPFAATYAAVVGTGGDGAVGDVDATGDAGVDSTFTEGATVVTGGGGLGGVTSDRTPPVAFDLIPGGDGGVAVNGDLNIVGGSGGGTGLQTDIFLNISNWGEGGNSIYGGNGPAKTFESLPYGAGGAPFVNEDTTAETGQDGADGLIVIEEFF